MARPNESIRVPGRHGSLQADKGVEARAGIEPAWLQFSVWPRVVLVLRPLEHEVGGAEDVAAGGGQRDHEVGDAVAVGIGFDDPARA